MVLGAVVVVEAQTTGSTFATNTGTGGLELTIDNKTFYNGELQPQLSWDVKHLKPWSDKFFNFGDVKPGDTGTTTMSIHIKDNPAFVCLDFLNLEDKENSINEPESLVDATDEGELSQELEFFAWRDDGDNVFDIGEEPLFGTSSQSAIAVLNGTTYALADSQHGPAYQPGEVNYIGITWCAGDLSVDLETAEITCDATAMGNEAQTDSMTLDVSIRATPSDQRPWLVCTPPHITPPAPSPCEIEGHKYDQFGNPLSGWEIGLMKTLTHSNGTDVYDLATDVTDENGYYCLRWDGETRVARAPSKYIGGPYDFVYRVYEKLQTGWQTVSIEKGASVPELAAVPEEDIETDGVYVSVQMGVENGYIYGGAEYHIDFYNQELQEVRSISFNEEEGSRLALAGFKKKEPETFLKKVRNKVSQGRWFKDKKSNE